MARHVHDISSIAAIIFALGLCASLTDPTQYPVRAVIIAFVLVGAVVLAWFWFWIRLTMFGAEPVGY